MCKENLDIIHKLLSSNIMAFKLNVSTGIPLGIRPSLLENKIWLPTQANISGGGTREASCRGAGEQQDGHSQHAVADTGAPTKEPVHRNMGTGIGRETLPWPCTLSSSQPALFSVKSHKDLLVETWPHRH